MSVVTNSRVSATPLAGVTLFVAGIGESKRELATTLAPLMNVKSTALMVAAIPADSFRWSTTR